MGALARTLWRIKIPPGDSARITQGLGGYTRRVRSRAPYIRITQGLGGYCRGPNIGVPNEVRLITIER